AVASGTADLEALRVIDHSNAFPPATLGYVYNLKPELAEKIRSAMLAFPWEGSGIDKEFAGSRATKFVPVSYKNDFEWARLIANAGEVPPDVAILQDSQNAPQ